MEGIAILTSIIVAGVLLVAAKVLLRGEPGVDFIHILGLVFVALVVLNIGVEVSQSVQEGPLSALLVVLLVSIIIFFTSDVMYEWGKIKSAIYAGVFAVSFVGVNVLWIIMASS